LMERLGVLPTEDFPLAIFYIWKQIRFTMT
jgi:hypothetical protein